MERDKTQQTVGAPSIAGATSPTDAVGAHYAALAQDVLDALNSDAVVGRAQCCSDPLTGSEARELYQAEALSHLPEGAKLASRGCGDPVAKAHIQPGEAVLDLGSGGGIDALIVAKLVGRAGQVYGIDMTDEMVELARKNAHDAGAANVEFIKANIEDIPLPDAVVDVIVSNCVINLCERKADVFAEAYRLLRAGGRMVVSDIVAFSPVNPQIDAPYRELTGCRNGVSLPSEYEAMLHAAGFARVTIEPKTIYTLEVLAEKAQRKGRMEAFEALRNDTSIDGTTGSAIITAYKSVSGASGDVHF